MAAIATIYEHSNYNGRALRLQGVGDYDYSTLASYSFNDLTSSINLESGYYLQAFADAGFKGASAIFTGSTSYVGNGFNDKISSLRLVRGTPNSSSTIDLSNYGAAYRQPSATIDLSNYGAAYRQPSATTALATLYEHANYGGRPLQLTRVGDYDYATLGARSFNDLISSIKLESGYYIQAYTDAGFKGVSAIFTGSTSYVGNGYNDKISSLRLVRGTPNSSSTIDLSNYGAAYRNKSTPSHAPGPDIITGQTINKISSPVQASGNQVPQGVWNKAGFVLGVTWRDPVTGRDVKTDVIPTGRGSYITHKSNDQPYSAHLWIWGGDVANAVTAAAIAAPFAALGGLGAGALAGAFGASQTAIAGWRIFGAAVTGPSVGGSTFNTLPRNWSKDVTPSIGGINQGKHLDVWGTMWDPQTGPGGSLRDFISAGSDIRQIMDLSRGQGNHNFI